MMENKCLRCGYEWGGKKKLKCCPACRNYRWNETRKDVDLKRKFKKIHERERNQDSVSVYQDKEILKIILKDKLAVSGVKNLKTN